MPASELTAPDHLPLPPVRSADEVVERFLAGTLDKEAWTHAAHLFVCRHLLEREPEADAALDRMRALIQAHNARVGLLPGHGGYHETITRYFVAAVAHADAPSLAALLTDPRCRREAPRQHWSDAVLRSEAARDGWVEPDLAPLPWV